MITVNGHRVVPTYFPDGCQQVWKLPQEVMDSKVWNVEWIFDSENQLVTMMQLSYLSGVREFNLTIPYLPYGRQDKNCDNNLTFGLGPFVNFIYACVIPHTLTLFDPHPANIEQIIRHNGSFNLLDSTTVMMPDIERLAKPYDLVCFPDKGAKDRYGRLTTKKAIYAEKVRDQQTGEIISLVLKDCDEPINGKTILVVDDICDGGRTFIELGKILHGAKADLYVSHGLMTNATNLETLFGLYQNIFTTDSTPYVEHPHNHARRLYERITRLKWKEVSV